MEEEKKKMMMMMNKRRSNAPVSDDDIVSLPGFRFHPTDEELVGFYLRRKVERKAMKIDHIIKLVDVYKYQPWDLPTGGGEESREMYYFCRRGRKYKNSVRPNRVTAGCGFWKATGIDKPIYSGGRGGGGDGQCVAIGLKKSLVYYRGTAGKGTKTEWMMHEFRLPPSNGYEAEVWTLCRIFKREASSYKKCATRPEDHHHRKPPAMTNHGYCSSGNETASSSGQVVMNLCSSSTSNIINDHQIYSQCFSNGSGSSSGEKEEAEEEDHHESLLEQQGSWEWDELRPMVGSFALHHPSIHPLHLAF